MIKITLGEMLKRFRIEKGVEALRGGADVEKISLMDVREKIGRLKYVKENEISAEYETIISDLDKELQTTMKGEDY